MLDNVLHFPRSSPYTGYVELGPTFAEAVRRFMKENGDRAAERKFGVTRFCLARAAARLPIQRGSMVAIVAALRQGDTP